MNEEIYGRKRVRRNDSFSGRPPAGELDIRTVAGSLVPGSSLEPYFALSRNQTIGAIAVYGFVASILPV